LGIHLGSLSFFGHDLQRGTGRLTIRNQTDNERQIPRYASG
jgi:hypothetical protein